MRISDWSSDVCSSDLHNALGKCLQDYAEATQMEVSPVLIPLVDVFESDSAFLDKVAQADAIFDNHPRFEELREITFDLLLMNFFAADVEKLESEIGRASCGKECVSTCRSRWSPYP